jgi:hypothetical protein
MDIDGTGARDKRKRRVSVWQHCRTACQHVLATSPMSLLVAYTVDVLWPMDVLGTRSTRHRAALCLPVHVHASCPQNRDFANDEDYEPNKMGPNRERLPGGPMRPGMAPMPGMPGK